MVARATTARTTTRNNDATLDKRAHDKRNHDTSEQPRPDIAHKPPAHAHNETTTQRRVRTTRDDDAQMRIAMMRSIVQLEGSGSIIAQRGSTSGSQKHAGLDGSYGLVIEVPHSSKSSIISHAATSAAGDLERPRVCVSFANHINGRARRPTMDCARVVEQRRQRRETRLIDARIVDRRARDMSTRHAPVARG